MTVLHALSLLTDVPPAVGAVIGLGVLAAADVMFLRWHHRRR